MEESDIYKTCACPGGFSNIDIAPANPEHALRQTMQEGMRIKNMEEIDIQNKLAAWQERMDKKREAEAEQRCLEAEKKNQQYLQRTGRIDARA